MNQKLYVSHLPPDVTETGLRSAFSSFGEVTNVFIATDHATGLPRGFAFVAYATPEETSAGLAGMNGAEFGGRALKVSIAREPAAPRVPTPPPARAKNFGPDRRAGAFQARHRR